MDIKCRKHVQLGLSCSLDSPSPLLGEVAALAAVLPKSVVDTVSPGGIAFRTDTHLPGTIPIPGYNAPALPLKPVRDPSLSLVALDGVDPTGPVMVEVPLVENNSPFTPDRALAGQRVGFAERYERDNKHERVEHSASFIQALDILRVAGVQLVAVPARQADATLKFDLQTYNEIDALISEYRLDALVSDSQSAAFHKACWTGYPGLGEPLEGGATLWFYGARWSKDSLPALVQGYRSARRLMPVQAGLREKPGIPTL